MATQRKRNRTPHQPTGQWISKRKRHAIYDRDDWQCQYCGRDLRHADLSEITLDHIHTQADGGSNDPSNLITACHTCNSAHKNIGQEDIMAKKARRNATVPPEERTDDQLTDEAPPAPAQRQEEDTGGINLRDRITGFERIDSSQIHDHPLNPRKHTNQQRAAMRGVLTEIGIADAVLVYHSERAGGNLVAIDGHMRKNDFGGLWPCLITDLSDAEADKYIQVHDPVSQMADTDMEIMNRLRDAGEFEDASVRIMLDGIDTWTPGKKQKGKKDDAPAADEPQHDPNDDPIPEMELQPYEHYDYLLSLFTTTFDWNWICTRLDIKQVDGSTDPGTRRIGLGRAIPGARLIAELKRGDEAITQVAELERELAKLRGGE